MTETALQVVTFENVDIRIVDHAGHKWAPAKEVGLALGYNDHRDFYKLMHRHPEDFEGKTAVITGVGKLPTEEFRIVSYHGIIRAAMLAKTKQAVAFRDWAEEVLFTVMTQGHFSVTQEKKTEVALYHERFHKDLSVLRGFTIDDPVSREWVYPRIQYLWDNYASNYVEPKKAVTRLTEAWFQKLYVGEKWSKDTMLEYFPLDISNGAAFDKYRAQCGIPVRKSLSIPDVIAMQMYRDYYQFNMRIDAICVKHLYYSQDSIRKKIKQIEAMIIKVMADNHVYGVKRWDKKAYGDYRAMEQWHNKKKVMVPPYGPFDLCWDCSRPISLATVHLHHLLYDRVGFELWTDFRPLCEPCHMHTHARDKVVAKLTDNKPKDLVRVKGVTVVEEREKAVRCLIKHMNKDVWFSKSMLDGRSQVKKLGDKGSLIIELITANSKGIKEYEIL